MSINKYHIIICSDKERTLDHLVTLSFIFQTVVMMMMQWIFLGLWI